MTTSHGKEDSRAEHHLQALDVHIVDVLAHLEALLRHSHSIQRELLRLRSEAPPPSPAPAAGTVRTLHDHTHQMQRECVMLADIISDLAAGVEAIGALHDENPASR